MSASSRFISSAVRIPFQLTLFGFLATAASNALGQTFWVGTPNIVQNWSTPGNWSLGVPSASSGTTFDAVIANGGAAQLSVTGASVRRLRVGRQEGPGQLFVNGGGGLTVTENLHINENGATLGAMTVSNGGAVTAPSTVVGYSSNGPSLLQVTNAGSTYSATTNFVVARAGIGTLVLSDSGELAVGNGTLPLQIATLAGSTGAAYLGNGGVAGVLTASAVQFGPGDGLLGFNHSDNISFAIPISGAGRLTKSGQGATTLSASNTYTGHPSYDAGTSVSRGTLEVTGSIAHPAANLQVGTFAPNESATLAIRGGGAVTNAHGYVGHAVESNGIVSVDGAGSTWTHGTSFVGYEGEGTLAITDGGHVTNGVGYIGYFANAIGSVTVDGPGSSWTNSFRLFIGTAGTGSMHVTNAGQVTSVDDASIGYAAGSNGSVSVDGVGSAWTVSDSDLDTPAGLYVGSSGSGSLYVTNGGVMDVTQATNGIQVGSGGTLGGDGTIKGAVYNHGVVAPGASPGTLHINGSYTQGPTGKLQMELDSAQSFDKLELNGGWLDGTLEVVTLDGYAPRAGHSYDILDWKPGHSLAGSFATLNLPALGGTLGWDTSQLYTTGKLSVTSSAPLNVAFFDVIQPAAAGPPYPAQAIVADVNTRFHPTAQYLPGEPMTPLQRLKLSLADASIPGEPYAPIPMQLAATSGLDGTALDVAFRLIPTEPMAPASSFDLFFELEAHPGSAATPVLVPTEPVIPTEPRYSFELVFDTTVDGVGLIRQTAHFEIAAGQPLLFANVLVGPPQSPAFHVTFDLLQTGGEVLAAEDLFTVTISAIATLAGDYNVDGTIDAADYVVWRKGQGTSYTQAHYDLWRSNFGQTAVPGAAAGSGATGSASVDATVPEPASLLLAFACGMGVLGWRHRSFRTEN